MPDRQTVRVGWGVRLLKTEERPPEPMKAREYQRAARTTAIYPAAAGIYYPALGLAGEVGEIANKVKKIIRGDVTLEQRRDDLKAELGDVMWYVAATASDLGLDLRDLAKEAAERPKLKGDLYQVVLELQSRAGTNTQLASEVRTEGIGCHYRLCLERNLVSFLVVVDALCSYLDTTLEEVCLDNIKKLFARKEAGTLQGDGDKR